MPRYSPDFNPIEMAFAKLKAAVRRAAARTFVAIVTAAAAFAMITAADARSFFAATGHLLSGDVLSTALSGFTEALNRVG